jgi:tRNA1Val (adenine37-N6)-methyltransferase
LTEESITKLHVGGLQVIQACRGYRFSIDPVLLCSFADISLRARVADLGTGSGVIPLLLYHYGKGHAFWAIERQPKMVCRARRTVELNSLQDIVEVVQGDISCLPSELQASFDAVVSNPPYRKQNSGRVAPDDERAASRHEITGTLYDFLHAASFLLKRGGRLFMVYLVERLAEVLTEMRRLQIEPKRLRLVHPRAGEPANLLLVEGRKHGKPGLTVETPLYLYQGPERDYTSEVLAMYESKTGHGATLTKS